MAGKSTFLRQNALIAVMAQAGSFVPASRPTIGVVDRLFSRVGAADDLARGRSTFMVEMVETAAILNQATRAAWSSSTRSAAARRPSTACRSPGRRSSTCTTSTSAARCSPRTITSWRARRSGWRARAHTMRVKEWQNEVVFLHEVAPGAADRSYGIHVAQLAGLPAAVVSRAEEVLAALEKGEQSGAVTRLADDLPLFAAAPARPAERYGEDEGVWKSRRRSAEINPDELSPREALDALDALRARLPGT